MKRTIYILCGLILLVGCKTTKSVSAVDTVGRDEQADMQFKYYFYEAQRCLSQQEYDKGMAMLMFCEQLDPKDAATQQALGYMYQATAQKDKALEHYKRAFEGEPAMYWTNYASLLFELGEKEKAAEVLERAASHSQKDLEILEALSTVYAANNKTQKALKVQDKIEAIEGINSYNTVTRYRLLLAEGKTEKAIQAIDNYLSQNPDDLKFRVFRADLYLAQGKEKEALDLYKSELDRNTDNPYVYISLSNYCASKGEDMQAAEYMQKAVLSDEWDLGQKLKALQDGGAQKMEKVPDMLEKTLIQLTKDYPIEEAAHSALAHYYISKSDYRNAKPELYTLLDINPDNSSNWQTTIQVLQADTTSGNDEYETLIRKAYKQMPDDPQWAYWMTRVHIVNQKTDSALIVAREGAEKAGDARYRLGLRILEGDMCTLQGDMEGTYAAYEKALAIDPNNIYVLNNYAYMLATHDGDLRRAEQMSRKTIEAEPSNATYLDTYAWILHLQKQDFLAQYYIEKAMENMKQEESEEITEHYKEITGKTPQK